MAKRWLMWVDGVGGYLLLPGDDWTIGGPSGNDASEICIQGDLARREACIRRQGSDYVLQPLGTVLLGGRRMNRPALLRDGDRLRMGAGAVEGRPSGMLGTGSLETGGVMGGPMMGGPMTGGPMTGGPMTGGPMTGGRGLWMEFAKPHPLSASARLAIESRHKTLPRCDGVILLADTCVIGGSRSSHVVVPGLDQELILLLREGQWYCRGGAEMRVDDRPVSGLAPIAPGARVQACGLCFSVEAVQG